MLCFTQGSLSTQASLFISTLLGRRKLKPSRPPLFGAPANQISVMLITLQSSWLYHPLLRAPNCSHGFTVYVQDSRPHLVMPMPFLPVSGSHSALANTCTASAPLQHPKLYFKQSHFPPWWTGTICFIVCPFQELLIVSHLVLMLFGQSACEGAGFCRSFCHLLVWPSYFLCHVMHVTHNFFKGKMGEEPHNDSGETICLLLEPWNVAGIGLRALHHIMASSVHSSHHYPYPAAECTEARGSLTPIWDHISLAAEDNVAHTPGNTPLLCYSTAQIMMVHGAQALWLASTQCPEAGTGLANGYVFYDPSPPSPSCDGELTTPYMSILFRKVDADVILDSQTSFKNRVFPIPFTILPQKLRPYTTRVCLSKLRS